MKMRLFMVILLGLALSPPGAWAQQWLKIVDRERQFTVRFPGQPAATDTNYPTATGASVPARLYSLARGTARYSLTVADFSANQPEEKDARSYAVQLLKEKGEAFHDSHAYQDGLPGDHLTIALRDGRRTTAVVHLFDHRLYVAEASDVKGALPTEPFVHSLIITHKDGTWLNLDSFNAENVNAFEDPD